MNHHPMSFSMIGMSARVKRFCMKIVAKSRPQYMNMF